MAERMVLLAERSPVRGRVINRVPLSRVEKMVAEGTAVKSRSLPGHLYETRVPKVVDEAPTGVEDPVVTAEENPADYETRVMKPKTTSRPSRTRRYRKED